METWVAVLCVLLAATANVSIGALFFIGRKMAAQQAEFAADLKEVRENYVPRREMELKSDKIVELSLRMERVVTQLELQSEKRNRRSP